MRQNQVRRFVVVLLGSTLAVFFVGFGVDGDETTNSLTYSVSDLEGAWLGDVTITYPDESSRTESNVGFRFDSQGKATEWLIPSAVSISGNLSVSSSGEIHGTLYGVNIIDVPNDIRDYTTMNMQGNFISKTSMDLFGNETYERSDGTDGSYTSSGTLTRRGLLAPILNLLLD